LHVVHDRLVEVVTGHANRFADADVGQGDDGHFRRAAADVDDHAGGRFGDGQAGADRGGHGLFDEEDAASAGALGGVEHGALFDGGDAGGDGDDDARADEVLAAVNAADEVAEHRLGDLEVGDHAVLERADGGDGAGRLAEHLLGDEADRVAV